MRLFRPLARFLAPLRSAIASLHPLQQSSKLARADRPLGKIAGTALAWLLQGVAAIAAVPNVPRTAGQLLVGPCAPQSGRMTMLAYHNGILYSSPETVESSAQTINGVVFQPDNAGRAWDLAQMLANPANPKLLHENATALVQPSPLLAVYPGMNNGFNAHGSMVWNDANGSQLIVNPKAFRATATSGVNTEPVWSDFMPAGFGPYTRGNMLAPWFATSAWVTYDPAPASFTLAKNNVSKATWDHIGLAGQKDQAMLIGNMLLYASTGADAGIAIYDLSLYMDSDPANDPATPPLYAIFSEGGFGGYWPEVYGWGGRLYVVGGKSGLRVVDITGATDPVNPTPAFIAAKTTSTMTHAPYPTFQDQFAFLGGRKIDMTTYQEVLAVGGDSVVHTVAGVGDGKGISTSQFNLPLGNLLVTGGLGGDQGMAIFAHQSTPDNRGPEVGFHIPRNGQTLYPVGAPISVLIPETLDMTSVVSGSTFIVRPTGGSPVSGRLSRTSGNCLLTFFPDAPLLANQTYEVVLPRGGIKDVVGNGIENAYSFTFSTGTSVAGNAPPVFAVPTISPNPAAPGSQLVVTASATDSSALTYRFDFRDGTGFSDWSASNAGTHMFAAAGHYNVTIQARDTAGAVTSQQAVITVAAAAGIPRPTQSNQIAKDANGKIWVVNPDNDSVSRLNPSTRQREATYALTATTGLSGPSLANKPSKDPRSIAVAADGKIWVTCHDDDAVRILNPSTGAVETTLSYRNGAAPFAVCMNPAGTAAYVTLYGTGELLRYNTANPTAAPVTTAGALVPTARAISVMETVSGERVLVTRFISESPRGEVLDVAWNSVGQTLTATRTIPLAYVGNLDGPSDGVGGSNYLSAVAIAPDGKRAYVTTKKDNITGGRLFGDGTRDIDADETVRAELRGIDLVSNAEDLELRTDLDNSDSLSALTFSPLGDYVFVPQQGNNLVTILDEFKIKPTLHLGAMVGRVSTGLAPQAVFVDAAAKTLLVHNLMDRTVSFLDISALLQKGTSNPPLLATTGTLASGTEKLTASVLFGKQLFYNASARDAAGRNGMSGEGYISCASCHIDGSHDGRVWDFTSRGEGLRNTTDLRGRRGSAHGDVHWSANFNETQDFVHDMTRFFGGSGFLPAGVIANPALGASNAGIATDINGLDPLDSLAAYVASLASATVPRSPFRNPSGSMTTEADDPALTTGDGLALFAAQNCTSCHTPAKGFTDSSLANPPTLNDVGTMRWSSGSRIGLVLPGIDTPTLAGAWETAPYFHDGSAKTLREVFEVTGGEMYALENGTLAGSATRTTDYVFINQANSTIGGFVSLSRSAYSSAPYAAVSLSNIDGGAGGIGALEVRYSNNGSTGFATTITVNGTAYPVSLPPTSGGPVSWRPLRVPNVVLSAGRTNTVQIEAAGTGTASLDELIVSRAEELARAYPHRRVLSLTAAEQNKLLAYLQQLDGSNLSDTSTPASRVGPLAYNDSFTLSEGSGTNLPVLTNDTGSSIALTRVSETVSNQGTVEVNGSQVRYTPHPWVWTGADSFSYAIRDLNGHTHWATANVSINRQVGGNTLPIGSLPALDLIGANVAADARTRADGRLEMSVTGGSGFDGSAWGQDSLAFAHKGLAGNFRVSVQIENVASDQVGARAGLMLRSFAGVGAPFVSLTSTTGGAYKVQTRLRADANVEAETTATLNSAPVSHLFPNKWAMIERVGNVVRTLVSADGITYDQVSETTLPGLGHWVSVGLVGFSDSLTGHADALFDQYLIAMLPQNQSAPDTSTGLLARYDFEDPAQLGKDSAGTHHGTSVTALSSTTAISGQRSLEVTGGQSVLVPFSADLELSNYSVAGWIRLETDLSTDVSAALASTNAGGVSTFSSTVRKNYLRSMIGSGSTNYNYGMADVSATQEGNLEQGGDLPGSQWFHLAVVTDGVARETRFFINGDLKRVIRYSFTPKFSKLGQALQLGGNSTGIKSWIDDIRVYNRVLNGVDVAALAGVTNSIDLASAPLSAYGTTQDTSGSAEFSENGKAVKLTGNVWKKLPLNYVITPKTVLAFEFKNTAPGEIFAIALDEDNVYNNARRAFQLAGTQIWNGAIDGAFQNYKTSTATDWVSIQIPVGTFYTGEAHFLGLINDHDVTNPTAQSWFRNLRIFEN